MGPGIACAYLQIVYLFFKQVNLTSNYNDIKAELKQTIENNITYLVQQELLANKQTERIDAGRACVAALLQYTI